MRNVAVAAMTKNLADELGPHGINVTVVHPGLTRTEATPGVIARLAAARGISPEEAERQPRPQLDPPPRRRRRGRRRRGVPRLAAQRFDHRRRHRLRRRATRPHLLLIGRAEIAEEQLGGRPLELELLVGGRREHVGDVGRRAPPRASTSRPWRSRLEPAVLEELVVDLGRLQLADQRRRDRRR